MVHRPALVSVKGERVNVSQVWNLNEVNPLAYTLGAAAKASGKSKATISKAIKSGRRLSALKDETGVYQIEGFFVYDAMIIAAALVNGCDRLLSEDMQDGMLVEGRLRIIDPFQV